MTNHKRGARKKKVRPSLKELEKKAYEPLTKMERDLLNNEPVPFYLSDTYNWAYVKPSNIDRLDKKYIYHAILFGQGWKLMNLYLDEIKAGSKMLQVAHVYGDLLQRVAAKIGNKGRFHIFDIIPYQVEKAKSKVGHLKYVKTWVQNAENSFLGSYDVIGIYFLLHEVPDVVKTKIIENALKAISVTGGKVVFIDYHNPAMFHPVRPILRLVNYFLEPYANSMWDKEIKHFTKLADDFEWKKETIFYGTYQKVVVTKK